MIVTITGNEGAGKTSVSRILAKKLNYEHHYIGGIRRMKARERNMTLDEYNKLGEIDPSTDREPDDFIKELGRTKDNLIIEGRTAWHFVPRSFKVFLKVNEMVGAKRVLKDLNENRTRRNEAPYKTIDEAVEGLCKRRESDKMRFAKYYGVEDITDPTHFDLTIETSHISSEETADLIIYHLERADSSA